MHHFEVVSSDIRGNDFQIVLRNSITGHQMTVAGSALGLAMGPGRRPADNDVRRLADSVANTFNQHDSATASSRRVAAATRARASIGAGDVPTDLRRQVSRKVIDVDKATKAAIKRVLARIEVASSRADMDRMLKQIDKVGEKVRQLARGSGRIGSSTRRRPAATRAGSGTSSRPPAKRSDRTPRKRVATTTRVGARPSAKRASTGRGT